MTGYESKRAAARDKLDGMDREALKLALEALQFSGNIWHMDCKKDEAIAAIEEALAQPAQELWCMKMNGCTTKCDDCPDEAAQPAQERNFCSRCGKRTADLTTIHTCTPPQEKNNG